MALPKNPLEISVPFGASRQVVHSRYHWNNDNRSEDAFVIIQRTQHGKGRVIYQDREHEVPEGHAFIVLVPEKSEYGLPENPQGPWELAWLNLYGELGIQLCREMREAFGPVIPMTRTGEAATLFFSLIRQAEQRVSVDPFTASTQCFSFLAAWTREASTPVARTLDPVQAAKLICERRFREPIGIKELAAETGLSREHFTRLFSARMKTAPAAYLRRLRAKEARQLLDRPGMTLTEAALRSGFASVKAMNRALQSLAKSSRTRRVSLPK